MTERIVKKCTFFEELFDELYAQCKYADKLRDTMRMKLEKLSEAKRRRLVARTKNGVTPLFKAAKKGNLAIVKYLLVKCKADVNKYCKIKECEPEMTALMAAKNVHVAHCLLEHGAKEISKALLEHISGSRLEVAEYLLRHGADPKHKNNKDEDALRLTCLRGHEAIFRYLMENVEYSKDNKADAYELMGAFYMSKVNPTYNPLVLEHWRTALKIRQNDGGQFLERKPDEPPPIKNVSEFRTEDDLAKLAIDVPSILVQIVLINHRILGYKHPVTYKVLSNLFDMYITNLDITNAFEIMMTINHIHVRGNSVLVTEITHKATVIASEMFSDIVKRNGVKYNGDNLSDVLATVDILWSHLMNPMVSDVHNTIVTLLYALLTKLNSEDHVTILKISVTKMVQKYCERNGQSLLHKIAYIKRTNFTTSQRKTLNFMRLSVIQLLLECGHDVDALDFSGSTPLHLEVINECNVDVVNCLLKYGAHIDRINAEGIRPCQLLDTVRGFDTFKYVTLKCLAARTIVDHKVPYKHLKFPALDAFIQVH